MKETLKRLLCMAMALAVVFAFAACDDEKKAEKEETEQTTQESTQEETTLPVEEEKTLVGKWEAQVDMADYISDLVYENADMDVPFDACLIEIKVTFDEDGTYKGKLKADFTDSFRNEEMVDTVIKLSAEQVGMTVEQFERQMKIEGYTREDIIDTFADSFEAVLYEMVESYEDEMDGEWLLEEDELYLDPKDPEDADPYIITLEDDSFTVTEIIDDDDDIGDYFLPLVFTRV